MIPSAGRLIAGLTKRFFVFPGKKPQKPPRPSLPKAADRKPAFTNTDDQSDPKPDERQLKQADPACACTCTRSVTVHWNIPINHLPVAPEPAETPPSNSDHSQRPVPRPRTKSHKQAAEEEAKVQTLVEICENFEDIQSDKQEVSSNKYLKELLEVFSADNECEVSSAFTDRPDDASPSEDAVGEMNGSNSQSFRARIQAFESQGANEEGNVNNYARQLPARKPSIKPPVAAKPSVSLKPQFTPSIDEFSQNVSSTNPFINPTTAPRPQPPEKLGGPSIKEELEALHSRLGTNMARGSQVFDEEPSFFPPKPPVKPFKEPLRPNLNINNHNSASMVRDNEYVDGLISKYILATTKPLNGSCFKINTDMIFPFI